MKFVYVTDLHGDEEKYVKALTLCEETGSMLLHIGADILPKGYSTYVRQEDFINKFLSSFIKKCVKKGIKFLAMFGNDDLWIYKKLYRRKCGDLLDEKSVRMNGFLFSGYPYVPDYPFGLKTACKYDSKRWKPEPYISPPVEAGDGGYEPIHDIKRYFQDKGTIKDDLRRRRASSNEIVAIHSPPSGHALDLCADGRSVGSTAIRRWIEKEQPYIVLSGHLHESPWITGMVSARIGKTLVIQPGQYMSAAVDPRKIETMDESIYKKHPYLEYSKLRAVIVEAITGKDPAIKIVDL